MVWSMVLDEADTHSVSFPSLLFFQFLTCFTEFPRPRPLPYARTSTDHQGKRYRLLMQDIIARVRVFLAL